MVAESDVDQLVLTAFFAEQTSGLMLEVGAARPDFLSVGAGFRRAGWRVISVEPNPEFAELHRTRGHEIIQVAAGNMDADGVDFTVVTNKTGDRYLDGEISHESYSSLGIRGGYAESLNKAKDNFTQTTISVNVRKLDTILKDFPDVTKIDVLSVDVEGWEIECLEGFSFGPLSPKVAIIENWLKTNDLRRFMKNKGYILWKKLHPNEVYVRDDVLPFTWLRRWLR